MSGLAFMDARSPYEEALWDDPAQPFRFRDGFTPENFYERSMPWAAVATAMSWIAEGGEPDAHAIELDFDDSARHNYLRIKNAQRGAVGQDQLCIRIDDGLVVDYATAILLALIQVAIDCHHLREPAQRPLPRVLLSTTSRANMRMLGMMLDEQNPNIERCEFRVITDILHWYQSLHTDMIAGGAAAP